MEPPGAPLVTIVVPTYNERQNLARLVSAIGDHVPAPYEILVVDDSSPDGTGDVARDLARRHPVRLLTRGRKAGLGSAYRDGFREARGDIVLQVDGDLSHDPRHIPALLDAVRRGADIAVGSRYVEDGRIVGWNAYRRLVSGTGNTVARAMLGLRVRDLTSGFRAIRREHLHVLQDARSDGYAFQVEALFLARSRGLRIVEVPITFENRSVGRSKLGASEFAAFLRTVLRLRVRGAPSAARTAGRPRQAR